MSSNVQGVIRYNISHMENIESHYKKASIDIENIISDLTKARNALEECYKGIASDINGTSIDRYINHMKFLKLCCEAALRYVEASREKMINTDSAKV